jgi:hypothetical protein
MNFNMRAVDHCIVHMRHAVWHADYIYGSVCGLHMRFGILKKILQYLNRSFIFEEFQCKIKNIITY